MTPGPGKADDNRQIGMVTVELLADVGAAQDKVVKFKVAFTWRALTDNMTQLDGRQTKGRLVYQGNEVPLKVEGNVEKVEDDPGRKQRVVDSITSGEISVGELPCPGNKSDTVNVVANNGARAFTLWTISFVANVTEGKKVTGDIDFKTTPSNPGNPNGRNTKKGAVPLQPWDPDHGALQDGPYPGQDIRQKERGGSAVPR